MKLVRNIAILFALDQGKKIILYETIEEIESAFPQLNQDHLHELKERKERMGDSILGFVRGIEWELHNPRFIHVTENDNFIVKREKYNE